MAHGARQSAALLREFQPQVCFVTGGYVCTPVAWAAKRMGVPVLISLPDLTPGLAIRALSLLAARVAVSFPEVAPWFPGKAVVTGYPLRAELHAAAADRPGARAHFNLPAEAKVLLVFGGSKGARSINNALAACLPDLLQNMHVIHVSGRDNWDAAQSAAADLVAGQGALWAGGALPEADQELAANGTVHCRYVAAEVHGR